MRVLGLVVLLFYCVTSTLCATITVDWSTQIGLSKTATTLQVVVNPQLRRGATMHDNAFKAIKTLQADYVRFVPWLPYPMLGVAELQPPAGKTVCGTVPSSETALYLECYQSTIQEVVFAAYGTPGGQCGAFTHGECDARNASDIVQKYCVGQLSCLVPTNVFGNPCAAAYLSVEVSCANTPNKTFWDFTLIDPMMEDLMEANEGKSTIINFSTIPQWMWNTPSPVSYPSDPNQVTWSYEQGKTLRDASFKEVGDYYARLVSWYTKGGFTDEFGRYYKSGYNFNIPMWEVLNEVDFEHSMTPEYYTKIYDAIVKSIQSVQPDMEFVGLALAMRNVDMLQYFLNSSNHQPGIPLHWISYHFYATTTNRTDTDLYETFFPQTDAFLQQVVQLEGIRKMLSPSTKTDLDELGVILPDDNVDNPIPIPDIYWNAVAATYAYIFGNLVPMGIDVLGASQLIGYPTQFPSVTLTRYPDGVPNARFWLLQLLHQTFGVGDKLIAASSDDVNVFAAAYATSNGKRILIVNKTNKQQTAIVTGLTSGQISYVDETTGYNPAATIPIRSSTITLNPFAVVIVSL
jgi:hypothetical protein